MDSAVKAELMQQHGLVEASPDDLEDRTMTFVTPYVLEKEETQRKIVAAIRGGATVAQAASIAGVSRVTFRKYAKEAEDGIEPWATIFNRFMQAVDEGILRKLAVIDRAAESGNWTAAAWWLERNFPEQYALKNRTELTGKGGEPIKITIEWPD